jgi:tRNA-Thr(GGU) m(6)t(6)A37 methyltransferase TsaA
MEIIHYRPIGKIRSPFTKREGMPIQPLGARGISGTVELQAEYADGLKDLDGFSHIILIYHFHLSNGYSLHVKPFLDDTPRGLFAVRAPRRPNPIGISVVRLDRIDGTILHISNVDIIDGTPLLDIKPCVPDFDCLEDVRTGWLSERSHHASGKRSDDRFGSDSQ